MFAGYFQTIPPKREFSTTLSDRLANDSLPFRRGRFYHVGTTIVPPLFHKTTDCTTLVLQPRKSPHRISMLIPNEVLTGKKHSHTLDSILAWLTSSFIAQRSAERPFPALCSAKHSDAHVERPTPEKHHLLQASGKNGDRIYATLCTRHLSNTSHYKDIAKQ